MTATTIIEIQIYETNSLSILPLKMSFFKISPPFLDLLYHSFLAMSIGNPANLSLIYIIKFIEVITFIVAQSPFE